MLGLVSLSASDTRVGYLFGAGAEYKFDTKWSGLIEYNFMDFGTKTENFSILGATIPVNITNRVHSIKAGVNYKIF